MTRDEIIEVLKPYKELLDSDNAERDRRTKIVLEGKGPLFYTVEDVLKDYDYQRQNSKERKKVLDLLKDIENPEFEKKFRSAHMKVFFNKDIPVENL